MTLKELIDSVEKTEKNKWFANMREIAEELDLGGDIAYDIRDDDFPELRVYQTPAVWMCTDTMVGIEAYYLNDELVAISAQQGRKCRKEFEWVSEAKAAEVRDLILSRYRPSEPPINLIDFNQDVSGWAEKGENWRKHCEAARAKISCKPSKI